jgi:cytidylate kinase
MLKRYSDFEVVSVSDIIRDEMRGRGIEISRASMLEHAKVREAEEPAYPLEVLFEKRGGASHCKMLVLESIRFWRHINWLKQQGGVLTLFVEAHANARFERVKARARDKGEYELTRAAFDAACAHASEREVSELRQHAWHIIYNNGNVSDLRCQIVDVVRRARTLQNGWPL